VLVYYAAPMEGRWWPISAVAGFVAVAGLVPLTLRQTRRILASQHPLFDVANALGIVVAVVVLGFATTYYTVQIHAPDQIEGLATKTDSIYFTVTVLATVGFGDIHPAGQVARAIATVNMLTNVAAVAVSVRMVAWAGKKRVNEEGVAGRVL
jgi:hypothetical protein